MRISARSAGKNIKACRWLRFTLSDNINQAMEKLCEHPRDQREKRVRARRSRRFTQSKNINQAMEKPCEHPRDQWEKNIKVRR